ncbi:MAG: iron-sulfur cluster repair protein YtfE [Rhodoferax sp.]|nr:iron-sulfur cluster repair protein YtfE [Rhodoferax sp.]
MNTLDQTLGQLARDIPGATGVFHAHQLDFCCGGQHRLREAASRKGLDGTAIAARLEALRADPADADTADWSREPLGRLIDHVLARFHTRHREQLPELIRLALRVEQVHAAHPDCPAGLADHLRDMQQELESHMQKEEDVLFPILAMGQGARAGAPITVMRMEHEQHGQALARLDALTHDATPPAGACTTWRALYAGLRTLREDLMEHIHLENNILFERAAAGEPAHA